MKWNDLSFFIWFVYCTHSHDSYVYEDNTRTHTHHMFDDRNRHKISQHMILWRSCFDMFQHVFMKKDYACKHVACVCVCVCACLLCPGSLFQAPSAGFPWVNSPKKSPEFVSSTLRYGNHILFQTCWAAFIPPKTLVTIVPNICRYKIALEGLESLVGHGVAGPQQANGTGGR